MQPSQFHAFIAVCSISRELSAFAARMNQFMLRVSVKPLAATTSSRDRPVSDKVLWPFPAKFFANLECRSLKGKFETTLHLADRNSQSPRDVDHRRRSSSVSSKIRIALRIIGERTPLKLQSGFRTAASS